MVLSASLQSVTTDTFNTVFGNFMFVMKFRFELDSVKCIELAKLASANLDKIHVQTVSIEELG